jgi:hypothetical protein
MNIAPNTLTILVISIHVYSENIQNVAMNLILRAQNFHTQGAPVGWSGGEWGAGEVIPSRHILPIILIINYSVS